MFNITIGNVELGCDGMESYKAAIRYTYVPCTQLANFDNLVSTLHSLIKERPV